MNKSNGMKNSKASIVSGKLLVIGSSNTDMVIKAKHFPQPGETLLGGEFFMSPGGKGANQAVSAARLGVPVTFICKNGNDVFGNQSIQLYKEEGININYIITDPVSPSGVALITVDAKAENCIVVAPGANAKIFPSDLSQATEAIKNAEIILMQLEIPLDTVEFVTKEAARYGKKVILNPAPATKLPASLMRKLFLITPNKTEAEILSGVKITSLDSAKHAAEKILESGVENVILTLGAEGAIVINRSAYQFIRAEKVKAVDTTAAGDVFNGALCAALLEGKDLIGAVKFAGKVAAISVTRQGAILSAPRRNEVFD